MNIAHINSIGLTQIATALATHHRSGGDYFTKSMLQAWASEAEQHYADGNDCYIEIGEADSVYGRPVVVLISAAGYDLEEQADDE